MMEKKDFLLLVVIALIFPVYVFSPFFSNSNYVPDIDETNRYPFIEKLVDPTLFPDDIYAERQFTFFENSRTFFLLVSFFRRFIPMSYVYNLVVPAIISLIIAFSLYNIGALLKNKRVAWIMVLLGLMHVWSIMRESDENCIGFSLVFPFIYFLLKKNELGLILITLLSAVFYPPAFVLLFFVYFLSKVIWKNLSISSVKINLVKFLVVLFLGVFLVFVNFSLLKTVSRDYALSTSDFEPTGFNPMIYSNLVYGIFSDSYSIGSGLVLFDSHENFNPQLNAFAILFIISLFSVILVGTSNKLGEFPFKLYLLPIGGFVFYSVTLIFVFYLPLYAPSRYFEFSFVPFMVILSGVGLYRLLLRIRVQWFLRFVIFLLILSVYFPFLEPNENICPYDDLYDHISDLPKDVLISANPAEPAILECIPLLSKRKVITASQFFETVILYEDLDVIDKEINRDTFNAYYSLNLTEVLSYCSKYGVTHFIISRGSFSKRFLTVEDTTQLVYRGYLKWFENRTDFYLANAFRSGTLLQNGTLSVIECNNVSLR